ncbi:MAG: ABC transporter permease [Chloroflexota bacterium]
MRSLRYMIYLLPLLFLAVFFFYPLAAIFNLSLRPEGTLRLDSLITVMTSRYYLGTLWFTLWQAALSTLLTLALALPGAYVFTRYSFRGKGLLLSLSTLPFVLPTVVVAAAFRALLWPNGVINEGLMSLLQLDQPPLEFQRTVTAILIAHVFFNYAIALRMITGYWANQSIRIEEAARVLGAHGWRLWLYVRLPILRPAITAAGVLVFIFTFTSFGVVLLLGGFEYATLEVEIYFQALYRSTSQLPLAAALSLVQIAVMFVMMLVYTRLQRRTTVDLQSAQRIARSAHTPGERTILGGNLLIMIGLLFTPLLALIWRSLDIGGAGSALRHYLNLIENRPVGRLQVTMADIIGVTPLEAIVNSLRYALLTTVIAMLLGLLTAYLLAGHRRGQGRLVRWLDPLFMLPLATSAVTLGFGYLISMDFDGVRQAINTVLGPAGVSIRGDWDLRSSWILIPAAHTLVAMPFVVRSVLPALRSIAPNITEAASVLGAPPWRNWLLVELPLISRGVIVGATFAFTVSMGEFGASTFVARPDTRTLPLAIEGLLGGAGTSGEAYAMSTILMLVCAASFIVIERMRTAGVGEF